MRASILVVHCNGGRRGANVIKAARDGGQITRAEHDVRRTLLEDCPPRAAGADVGRCGGTEVGGDSLTLG